MVFFQITCEALNAHPAPQLSWVEPQDAEVDITAQPEISTYDTTADIRHTIKYKAHLRDNGGQISCIGSQVARDGRTVLYEKTATVKLRVEKLVLPVDNALTQKIGIISGVLLAVIFLILLMVFVIFAVCKRRRKRSRPPSSTGTEDTCSPEEPPLKPIWTTTPMNGVKGGAVPLIQARHVGRSHHLNNTLSQATVCTQSTGRHFFAEKLAIFFSENLVTLFYLTDLLHKMTSLLQNDLFTSILGYLVLHLASKSWPKVPSLHKKCLHLVKIR